MTLSPEHLAWRAAERRITDKLLLMFVQALEPKHQRAAAESIRDHKSYPR